MQEELSILLKAQYPLIYLVTSEEERAEQAIYRIAQGSTQHQRLFVWTVTHGFREYAATQQKTHHNTISPEAAIEWVIRQEPGIFIFKDLHPFISSPAVTRWLREAIASFKGSEKAIILMSPYHETPIELEKDVVVLDFALPNLSALDGVLSQQLSQTRSPRLGEDSREKLLKAALTDQRRGRKGLPQGLCQGGATHRRRGRHCSIGEKTANPS
jgi:hypothetical protein